MAQLDRMNVAPVSNLADHYGNIIPAGTVGNLCYSVRRRRWTFVVRFTQYRIDRADLFRFVPRSELESATLGHDVAHGEPTRRAQCMGYRNHVPHLMTDGEFENATRMSWNDGTPIDGAYRCAVATSQADNRPTSQREVGA
jgi:hypothetical protein